MWEDSFAFCELMNEPVPSGNYEKSQHAALRLLFVCIHCPARPKSLKLCAEMSALKTNQRKVESEAQRRALGICPGY